MKSCRSIQRTIQETGQKDMVIHRMTAFGIWASILGLILASYAGGQGKAETSPATQIPETLNLGRLAQVYEPLTFSHQTHSLIAEDCAVCHHHAAAGETRACGKCHQASSGSKESGPPALKDAYHQQCIGCHKEIEMGPRGCTECHTKKASTVSIVAPGERQVQQTPGHAPETMTLSGLEKRYEPVAFSHSLHADMGGGCGDCHHHSPAGQTLACGRCHGEPFNPQNLSLPGLKGAYHLQCLGCHREMDAGPVGCTECHARKTTRTVEE